jgi:hypothetical protein
MVPAAAQLQFGSHASYAQLELHTPGWHALSEIENEKKKKHGNFPFTSLL